MGDDAELNLPRGLDLLWGLRERGRKGPKPALTIDAIVEAAIAIADEEGLGAVSMARVAAELGFTTMSLYRYVDSKDELLALMWNASAAGAPAIVGNNWREKLVSWANLQRTMLMTKRPWVLQMPMAAPPAGPNSLAFVEQAMAALEGTGLTPAEALGIVGLLSSYTLSEARMAHDFASAQRSGEPTLQFAALLRAVADEQTYPTLFRAAWSGELDTTDDLDDEQSFQFGLDRILDGIQMLIDERAAARASSATQ